MAALVNANSSSSISALVSRRIHHEGGLRVDAQRRPAPDEFRCSHKTVLGFEHRVLQNATREDSLANIRSPRDLRFRPGERERDI
jgi:hypothetical protein